MNLDVVLCEAAGLCPVAFPALHLKCPHLRKAPPALHEAWNEAVLL